MKKFCMLLLVILSINFFAGHANCNIGKLLVKSLKTEQDCIKLSKQAGELIHKGSISQAFDVLHTPEYFIRGFVPQSQKNVIITNIKALHTDLTAEFGPAVQDGFECIGTAKTGNSLMFVYFFAKHEFSPIPWKMTFYKPKNEWKFLEFNTGPELLIELGIFLERQDSKTN